jgi:hypothetical protein
MALFSDEDDVTLGNPFGPYARGSKKVEETLAGAAANYRDGDATQIELVAKYLSSDLAVIVEVERGRSKVGGNDDLVPVGVRVSSVFRLERGQWRRVHRHADPILSSRPASSTRGRASPRRPRVRAVALTVHASPSLSQPWT